MANIFEQFFNRIKDNAQKSAAKNTTATVGGRTVSTNTGSGSKAASLAKAASSAQKAVSKSATSLVSNPKTVTVGGRDVSTITTQSANRKFSDTIKNLNNLGKATTSAISAANKVRVNNGISSPIQGLFQKAGKALNAASDYIENNSAMNPVQKSHLDSLFKGKIDTQPVKDKIKSDPTYASKLIDQDGGVIDYTPQIDEVKGKLENTYNPYERKQLKEQLSLLQEYQSDQNKLLWESNYNYLVENGASEKDLEDFKIAVNRNDMDGINRALANFTSTVEGYVGNAIKGSETMFATVSDLLGVDYKFSPVTDKIIDDAETLQALSLEGASGMEKLVYETYDGMAPFLYALGIAQFIGGASSYIGNREAAEALNARALLMSDISTLGSAMKQNLSKGYSFEQSRDNAYMMAALGHITESIGGESLANIITGEIGEDLLENTLDYMIRSLGNQFASEAAEEGMEAVASPLIDAYTLQTGMTVNDYLNQVFSKDTAHQMLIGGLGGLAMGGLAAGQTALDYNAQVTEIANSIMMDSKRDYNAAVEAADKLEEIVSATERSGQKTDVDNEQIFMERMLLKAFRNRISQYQETHPYMDAIVSESDIPQTSVSGNAREDILNAAVPTVNSKLNEIVAQKEMITDQSNKAAEVLQNSLNKEGVNISAMDWAGLTEAETEAVRTVNNYAKLLNKNVSFANLVDTNGDIIDGVYMDGHTVINPKAQRGALSTMLHEFTHGTESSEHYKALSDLTAEYFGEGVDDAVQEIKNRYSTTITLTDEGAMKELTAITTQELLDSPEFVDRLVRYNSSLAYKLYEEIKYMNENTGNIESAIEQSFMRAFADEKNDTNADKKAQLAIGKDKNGTVIFARNELSKVLDGFEGKNFSQKLSNYLRQKYRGKRLNVGGVYDANFTRKSASEFTYHTDELGPKERSAKYQTATDLELLLEDAVPLDFHVDKKGGTKYYDHFYVEFGIQENDGSITDYEGIVSIRDNPDGSKRFHDLSEIKERGTNSYRHVSPITGSSSNNRISNFGDEVKNDADNSIAEEVVINTEEGSAAKLSLATWIDTDKKKVATDLASKLGVSLEKAQKWVKDVSSVAKTIADNRMVLDYEPNPNYSSMKSNDEYVASMDMSTLCKKREVLQGTIDEIQRRLPNYDIDGAEYTRIRQMMKDRGYEVACGFCYVESRRKELGKVAKGFIEARNYDDITIRDLTTVDGVAELQKNRPEIYEDFVKFNNKRGSGKVNLVQSRTEYRGEIVDHKMLTEGQIEKINRIGGLRLQSYSDFETPHLIDMMQIVIDMSRRGLTSQAYTKVPAFADAFGKTNIKINESLVCKGVDSKGKLIFDDIEGMPHEEAFRIRKKHPKTVGTILVGKDDATIKAAMADPRIDFIIPFHRSGWGKAEYAALGIDGYKDYTDFQKEYWIEPKQYTNKNGKVETEKAPGDKLSTSYQFYPIDYWDYSKSGKENAEKYLELCAEDGRIPKFSNFLVDNKDGSWSLQPDGSTDGYWKMLIDFKMYDNNGVGAPQEAVQPIFDNKVNQKILNSYEGDHTKNRFAADVVDEFVSNVKNGVENKVQLSKSISLDQLSKKVRSELRELSDRNRRVSLKEDVNAAINDIVRNGEVSQSVYDALRKNVVASTMTKLPNDAYDIARGIRKIMGSNFLSKDQWDVTMNEINEKYNLFNEHTFPTSYNDARDMLNDYFNSIGDKDLYLSPVQLGDMSEEDYESMIDGKLDQVISMIKDSISNRADSKTVGNDVVKSLGMEGRLYDQEMENLADTFGNESLNQLLEEDNRMQAAIETAAAGAFTPEAIDQLEDDMLSNLTIEDAKRETKVLSEVKKDTKKPLRSWKDRGVFYQIRQKIFDKGIAIRDLKNSKLSASYDMLLSANNMANYSILEGCYDNNGHKVVDSLTKISGMIPEEQKNDFDYYMYHKHNIDASKIGKPVFFNFDQAMSERIVNQYELMHPEWKKVAQKYYDYNDYLLNKQVESGVITRATANLWKELYPHYVPTKRVLGTVDDGSVVETADPMVESANKGTLYERTGGNSPIQPLDYAMAEHTKQIYKSSLFNRFAKDYIDVSHAKTTLFNEDSSYNEDIIQGLEDQVTKADEYTPATLIYYSEGDRHIVEIPKEIYDALGPTQTPFDLPSEVPFVSWVSSLRRNMITGANPVFWATNAIKDFQDIAFNSKYAKDTYGNLIRAYKQLIGNGEIAQLYKSLGGEYNTYLSEEGTKQNEHSQFYKQTIGRFIQLNDLIEMAPRLAEFMSSLDHGDSVETAMYNASEVTTNFKRGGDYAKWFNRNGWTFLNASIQGFDKQIRNIDDAYDSKGWKGVASYLAKANLISGIPLIVLNGLLHRDDKDYEQLSDYIKDNYYILWKYDDGKFVRIPKGRIANAYQGILSAFYEDGVELASDDSALDKAKTIWENTLDSLYNVWEQIGINDPLNNNLLSPITQVVNNEAWYGDPIVSTYMQKKDPADQYDESTDIFSVWLGQKTNLSPKKINYLIDQYSGGAGDVVLPILTPKAETGFDDGTLIGGLTSAVISPYADKFTTDSVFKNQNVTDFFTLDEELTRLAQKEHASDETILASKYINSIQKQMNDLYAEKRAIYNSDQPDSLKYDQARDVQRKIDDLAKLGIDTYDQMDVSGYYADLNGVSYYKNSSGEWTKSRAEKDDELTGLSTKEKSDYYFVKNEIADLREQVKADTPEGQDADYRSVTIDAIQNSNLSPKAKNQVYDSYYSGKITENINAMNVSDEKKLAMKIANAQAVSLKDANGKTISNSKALYVANVYASQGVLQDVYNYISQNDLSPSDFGLTKTVVGYSIDKLSSEFKKMYGKEFGSGGFDTSNLGPVSYNMSNNSSSSKKSSSRGKTSSQSRSDSNMTTEQKKVMRQAIKSMQKYFKTFQTNDVDLFNVLRNSTSVSDAKKNVERVMRNAKKGQV